MARSVNQKRKLLYILSLLQEESDENHPLSMKQILAGLERNGISAERKSVYSDIEELQSFGYDIQYRAERPGGYYLGAREFELPELKLLVDAVQASKFVTERQTNVLIKKLERFTSRYEADKLQRQVRVHDQIKSVNLSTLYLIDDIHQAIHSNRAISFFYYEWNLQKRLVKRHDGKKYVVSPWALLWEDENYYLVAFDHEAGIIKYFRVEKMKHIEIEEKVRCGKDEFLKVDMERMSRRTFGMFAGEEKNLTLEFENRLVGVALDRFGSGVPLIVKDEEHFQIMVKINISPQFYGWLAGLGTGVRIAEPEKEAEKYIEYLEKIIKTGNL